MKRDRPFQQKLANIERTLLSDCKPNFHISEIFKGLSHVQGKNWDLMKCETKDNQEFLQPEIIEFIYV